MGKLLYEKESYVIREAVFEVWKQFGGAFKESIIDNALAICFRKKGLRVDRQKHIAIYYEGQKIGSYVPDQIINDSILIELKSKPTLTLEDRKQFWYYLKGSDYHLGFLINFGNKLEIFRRVYDEARTKLQRLSASSSA